MIDNQKNIALFDDNFPEYTHTSNGGKQKQNVAFNKSKVYLLISVDLTNATQFKAKEKVWIKTFDSFHKIIVDEMMMSNLNSRNIGRAIPQDLFVWKRLGDEVLFYRHVNKREDILFAPQKIYNVMIKAQEKFFENSKKAKKHNLHMKSSVWVADVGISNNSRNFIREWKIGEKGQAIQDFVGSDIDEGFRMASRAVAGKVTVDPKIKYLFYDDKTDIFLGDGFSADTLNSINNNIQFMGYTKLKGVWGGKDYPMYFYDERKTPDILDIYKMSGVIHIPEAIKKHLN